MSPTAPEQAIEAPATVRGSGGPGWRRKATIALGTLTIFILVLTIVVYWADSTLLDSDEFTGKASGVISEPETSERIGTALARQVLSTGEVQERIAERLPENAQFLPVLLEDQLETALAGAFARLASLESTQNVITMAVHELHGLVVSTLEGRRDALGVEDQSLVLNLNEMVIQYLQRLDARLGTNLAARAQAEDTGRIVLVSDVKALDQASFIVRSIDTAVPVLAVLSLVGLAGVVALSSNLSSGFSGVGVILLVVGLLVLLLWRFAGALSSNYLAETVVARSLIDAFAAELRAQAIFVLIAGGVVVLASERRIRAWFSNQASRASATVGTFGVARTALVGVAGVAVALLVS